MVLCNTSTEGVEALSSFSLLTQRCLVHCRSSISMCWMNERIVKIRHLPVTDLIFLGSKITVDGDFTHEIKRHLLIGRKAMLNLDSILKSREITLPTKVRLVKALFFPGSYVWMWELEYKESWVPRNWCFWTVVIEKTLESPLDCKEIQPVHLKGNWPCVFIGRTDVEAETSILILATWCKELTHLKRPWYWERLKAGGEGGDSEWDG